MAEEAEMDLVIIAKNEGDVPVAKIVDWAKFKYEQSKKSRKAKKNQATVKGNTALSTSASSRS